jgi:hypothetical protein
MGNSISHTGKCVSHRESLAVIVKKEKMTFKEDITTRIKIDFGIKSDEVFERLTKAIEKTEYISTDRVIRSIIFLSEGNLQELNRYIEVATYDTRDVMFWAEYENLNDNSNPKRIRDFNKTFEESTNDVKE